MKNKRILNKLAAVLLCASLLISCSSNAQTKTSYTDDSSNTENGNTASSSLVEYEEDDFYVDWTDQNPNYIKLNGTNISLEGSGASIKGSAVTITKAGVYVINGKLDDGQIIVDTEDKGVVRLVMNGAEINCSDNSPIYVINSEKTVISIEDGKENIITDGAKYVLDDDSSDEPNSAIFSKADLTINGTGTLTVTGNYNNGITSKDDLKITGGNIVINSVDDALMGRDMVAVKDGNIIINAGGQGIKTTNDTDTEKGCIYVEGGTFSITSTDDSIHSINGINITNGEISIASGDDGIHADSSIDISGGSINISKSYEGIESTVVTISNGDINVVASDDGINIAGGNDSSSTNGRPGQNDFSANSDCKLNINGGSISVNAAGDGLDSNGSIYMTGGNVIVNGPTSNGNGPLDYNGVFNISGGTIIAAGSSGMAQTMSDTSTQNSVMINFSGTQKQGTSVHLEDSDGTTILTFEPEKEYQSIVMSSSDLKLDKSYTLFIDDTSIVTFKMSKSVLKISNSGEEITGSMMQGPGNVTGGTMQPQDSNTPPQNAGGKGNPGEKPAKPDSTDETSSATPQN